MKLQKVLSRLQKLHPKEIDLSLDRIKSICNKLNNPQDDLKCIQVCGTNGKFGTIQALRAILKEAGYKCNIYTSPHIKKINERFVYNDKIINDNDLAKLLIEIEKVNNGDPLTYFEALTAAFFLGCRKYKNNLVLAEFGLFGRFDAVNILKRNVANIITSISVDHQDWLPKGDRGISRIIYEKTSFLLNSKIIVAKQNSKKISKNIKMCLKKNSANKIFYGKDYKFFNENDGSFIYKDKFGVLKLPRANVFGQFQLENISTAIATLRYSKQIKVKNFQIKRGIKKIYNIARLQEIQSGKLKSLVKKNRLIVDGSHNEDGSRVLNNYLQSLKCKKHIIIGMMKNKNHEKYIKYFKNISSIVTVDIPNQPNSIKGIDLKKKFKNIKNIKYEKSIKHAIRSIDLKKNDILVITGSLYLAGEALNMN